eukprot:6181817-Pleurochrysis_carterae.AAC.3
MKVASPGASAVNDWGRGCHVGTATDVFNGGAPLEEQAGEKAGWPARTWVGSPVSMRLNRQLEQSAGLTIDRQGRSRVELAPARGRLVADRVHCTHRRTADENATAKSPGQSFDTDPDVADAASASACASEALTEAAIEAAGAATVASASLCALSLAILSASSAWYTRSSLALICSQSPSAAKQYFSYFFRSAADSGFLYAACFGRSCRMKVTKRKMSVYAFSSSPC